MEIFSRPKLGVALWTLGDMPLAESGSGRKVSDG